MTKFSGKFEQIHEAALTRFQQQGFLLGDYIKFKKDAMKNDCVRNFSEQMQAHIQQCIKNDIVLKVSDIKSPNSEAMNGPVGAANVPRGLWADVYVEHAPGMFSNVMTIPLSIVDKVVLDSDSEGYRPYDKKLIRKNDQQTIDRDGLRDKQTLGKDPSRQLPKTNVKL